MLGKAFFRALVCHLLIFAGTTNASANVPEAYRKVAIEESVPYKILFAVAMVESRSRWNGKSLPWPWTLNIRGKPFFFNTKAEAEARLILEVNRGNDSIAIGIMQIYWKYHKDYFTSPTQLLDPMLNLRYGARYLRKQYLVEGDWYTAAGQYHSGSKSVKGLERAKKYETWVKEQWKKL